MSFAPVMAFCLPNLSEGTGRSYGFGDRAKPNKASKRPLTQASLRCKRWLKPSSLHRIPTPLKRCWMSHLQALSTIPAAQRQSQFLVHRIVDVLAMPLQIRIHRRARCPVPCRATPPRPRPRPGRPGPRPACHAAGGAVPSQTTGAPGSSAHRARRPHPSTGVAPRGKSPRCPVA